MTETEAEAGTETGTALTFVTKESRCLHVLGAELPDDGAVCRDGPVGECIHCRLIAVRPIEFVALVALRRCEVQHLAAVPKQRTVSQDLGTRRKAQAQPCMVVHREEL